MDPTYLNYPIATLAVPGMRYDVRIRETGETVVPNLDLDTALAEVARLNGEARANIHVAQEIMTTESGNIG